MSTEKIAELTEELKQFQAEKEKIRKLVGQVGGKVTESHERILNIIFIALLVLLFVADIARHFFNVQLPITTLLSIEIGLMLVSIKIIWMIHKQTKVEHFQFWILNSIEFRIDQISHDIKDIKKQLKNLQVEKSK